MMTKYVNKLDVKSIDEIGLRISYKITQLVVNFNLKKSFWMIDLDNHDYITSVDFINSNGETTSFIFSISRVNILSK